MILALTIKLHEIMYNFNVLQLSGALRAQSFSIEAGRMDDNRIDDDEDDDDDDDEDDYIADGMRPLFYFFHRLKGFRYQQITDTSHYQNSK